jgi:hypothetical protein
MVFRKNKREALSKVKNQNNQTQNPTASKVPEGSYRNYSAATTAQPNQINLKSELDKRDKKLIENLSNSVASLLKAQTESITEKIKPAIITEIAINNTRLYKAIS